jgi:uncharacterized protein YycO
VIALYRGISPLSRAIRFFTQSIYSHASWVLRDGSVVEAWKNGVRHEPSLNHAHTPGTAIELFDFEDRLTEDQVASIESWLLAQVGRKYDWADIIAFVLQQRRPRNSEWFCSELVFAATQHVGRPVLARIEPWQVYPGLLAFSPLLVKVNEVRSAAPPREQLVNVYPGARAL